MNTQAALKIAGRLTLAVIAVSSGVIAVAIAYVYVGWKENG